MNQLDSFCVTSHAPHAMEEASRRVTEGDRLILRQTPPVLRWTGERWSQLLSQLVKYTSECMCAVWSYPVQVLFQIDANSGFEMETFEFQTILQTDDFSKFKNQNALKKINRALKQHFGLKCSR